MVVLVYPRVTNSPIGTKDQSQENYPAQQRPGLASGSFPTPEPGRTLACPLGEASLPSCLPNQSRQPRVWLSRGPVCSSLSAPGLPAGPGRSCPLRLPEHLLKRAGELGAPRPMDEEPEELYQMQRENGDWTRTQGSCLRAQPSSTPERATRRNLQPQTTDLSSSHGPFTPG